MDNFCYLCFEKIKRLRMNRCFILIASLLLSVGTAVAQPSSGEDQEPSSKVNTGWLKHMDVGVSVGSTGVGIDAAFPIGKSLQVRTGFDYMPRVTMNMNFGIQVGEDSDPTVQDSKFDKLSGMLESFVGTKVDRDIDMKGKPTAYNFKLLVDVKPFRNKHWHLTGGFYWGPSKFAEAVNSVDDATSLVAVAMYNTLYERVVNAYVNGEPFINYNGHDFYLSPDETKSLYDKFTSYGRMGVHIGDFKDGTPYMLEPSENNTVRAQIKVNNFKPYLGFGYGGALLKHSDRYTVSFDCGVLFWGGTPQVLVHNYHLTEIDPSITNQDPDRPVKMEATVPTTVDLAKDLDNVRGKVGTYTRMIKKFKVYPVLNFRIARKLF